MRWRWRKCNTPDPEPKLEDKHDEAVTSLERAEQALVHVREQKKSGKLIAETLSAIRKENHFKEIWNQGMRGE